MTEARSTAIVILCKPLAQAKQRLAPLFGPAARAALAEAMLRDVIAAAVQARSARSVAVRSADPRVGSIAHAAGIDWQREHDIAGLSAAAAAALADPNLRGDSLLMLLPADLPLARAADIDRLTQLGASAGVRARDGGTNALLLDPARRFDFRYGPASFALHMAEARRRGDELHCLLTGGLIDDIDTPESVARLMRGRPGTNTSAFLADNPDLMERVA